MLSPDDCPSAAGAPPLCSAKADRQDAASSIKDSIMAIRRFIFFHLIIVSRQFLLILTVWKWTEKRFSI